MVRLPTTSAREPLIAVDVLRLIAALSVMAFHYGTLATSMPDPRLGNFVVQDRLPAVLSRWLDHGWIGVEIFFVISGYVIAMSAVGSSRSAFVRRRVLRLVPTAWLCATVTLAALLLVGGYDTAVLLRQWLFSVTLFPIGEAIDPSYWTIGVELSFYAVVALSIDGDRNNRALIRIAAALGVIGAVFWGGVLTDAWPYHFGRVSELLLLEHGCFFALGMVIRLNIGRAVTPCLALALAGLIVECIVEIIFHQQVVLSNDPFGAVPTVAAFLAAVFLLVISPALQSTRAARRFARVATLMGKATYPLYLVHRTTGSIIIGVLLSAGIEGSIALVTTVVTIVALAIWITVQLEPKVRSYLGKRFMPPRAHPCHGRAPDNRPTAFPSAG